MGIPTYLNKEQIQKLVKASELTTETVDWSLSENGVKIEVLIQPHSVVAIKLVLAN